MFESDKDLLQKTREFLVRNSVKQNSSDYEVISFINSIFDYVFTKNEYCKELRGNIIGLLEEYSNTTVKLFVYYLQRYLLNGKITVKQVDDDHDEEIENKPEKAFTEMQSFLQKNTEVRLSVYQYDDAHLINKEKLELHKSIISMCQISGMKVDFDNGDIKLFFYLLAIFKTITKSLDKAHDFYFMCYLFLQRMNSTKRYQYVRDLAEEIYLSAFNDNVLWAGCLVTFSAYAEQHNFPCSLFFGCAYLYLSSKDETSKAEGFYRFLTSTVQLLRNLKLFEIENKVFNSIPNKERIPYNHSGNLYLSHINSLLTQGDSEAGILLKQYLQTNRERILGNGERAVFTWTFALRSFLKVFPDENIEELNLLLTLFTRALSNEAKVKLENLIEYNLESTLSELTKHHSSMLKSRHSSDFSAELRTIQPFIIRTIDLAIKENNINAFIYAAYLQSDLSFGYDERYIESGQYVHNFDEDEKKIDYKKIYSTIMQYLQENKDTCILFISNNQSTVYYCCLSANNEKPTIQKLSPLEEYNNFSNHLNDYLFYDEYIESKGQRIPFDVSSQNEILKNLIENNKQLTLQNIPKSKNIVIIRSKDLTTYPSNLFIVNNHLIINNYNIFESFSFDSLNKAAKEEIKIPYRIAMLNPITEQDLTLNYFHNRVENLIQEKNISFFDTYVPGALNHELNILVSHGLDQPEKLLAIAPSDDTIVYRPEYFIGSGKLLILLVCHSGLTKNGIFNNQIHSLVRLAFQNNYQAVIAPRWSLNIHIASEWLKIFFNFIGNTHSNILEAYSATNQELTIEYPAPGASAIMHYYGSPLLEIENANIE